MCRRACKGASARAHASQEQEAGPSALPGQPAAAPVHPRPRRGGRAAGSGGDAAEGHAHHRAGHCDQPHGDRHLVGEAPADMGRWVRAALCPQQQQQRQQQQQQLRACPHPSMEQELGQPLPVQLHRGHGPRAAACLQPCREPR